MDTLLKPGRLNVDPNSPSAVKEWKHWLRTFKNFITECRDEAPDEFRLLINYVSPSVFEYIEDCTTYDGAIETLTQLYVKTPNEIFARHLLATLRQNPGESLNEFLQELQKLSKDCNLKAVSAAQYREEMVRDCFINGIASPLIRQRLLENKTLDLKTAFDQASALDLAQKYSEAYTVPTAQTTAAVSSSPDDDHDESTSQYENPVAATYSNKKRCFFCGGQIHNRKTCPARNATCGKSGKNGQFSKVCQSRSNAANASTAAAVFSPTLCTITAACPQSLSQAVVEASLNGQKLSALIDSGSSDSFISEEASLKLNVDIHPSSQAISMALTTLKSSVVGTCFADITINNSVYTATRLGVLKNLCSDVILGQDFQKMHQKLTIEFGGSKPDLKVTNSPHYCALSEASLGEPSLFANLHPDCKPVSTRSRRFSKDDQEFIEREVSRLLSENVIEPSNSPWRAQVVIAKDPIIDIRRDCVLTTHKR